MSPSIFFHNADHPYVLKHKTKIRQWILDTILAEKKTLEEISYVFCSDNYLLKINQNHLNHDTYTDIITFDYSEGNLISSEIYISIDRVKENAKTHSAAILDELHRVIIHGVLHLCGYKDKTTKEAEAMRRKEDLYLGKRNFDLY